MTSEPMARGGTALSPEWDRGFDEAFTELIAGDPDLVREEFDELIGANFADPPQPPPPPAPSAAQPASPRPEQGRPAATVTPASEHPAGTHGNHPRSPPDT